MGKGDPKAPTEIRELLEGPVMSIPTPFLADGAIDWDGIANIIEVGIGGGTQVTLLTAGDSQFLFMSEAEIAELTRFVVERAADRTLLVAATGQWSTQQSAEFARFCRETGADVLMNLPAAHAQAPRGLAANYLAIAEIMPVMLVGFPAHAVLDQLLGEPAICCFKEDGTEAYAIQTLQKYGDRFKFMAGGVLGRHLAQWPFGCRSFMDWSTSFAPQIGAQYWQALQSNDVPAAARVVREVETPLFVQSGHPRFTEGGPGFPGGWQAMWRACLELNGVASRHLRLPQLSGSDEDLERLRPELERLGLLGGSRS